MLQKLAKLLPLLALATAAPTSLTIRDESGRHHNDIKVGGVLPDALMSDVQAIFDYFGIPGGVISVVSPEEGVNGVEVIGVKDKEGNKMDADTFHSIGSNSKFTTAIALAAMEASGNYTLPNGDKFTTDAKWKDVYPQFKMVDQNATEQATLANFMTMNTGIPTVNFAIGRDDNAVETLQRFAQLTPNVPFPSNISQYSTIHWNAVAGVPDFVADISLDDFLETYIWGPADIEAKNNALEAKETGRRGQAFTLTWEDQAACTVALTNGSLYNATEACAAGAEIFDYWSNGTTLEQLGGGSVLMTGKDMYKWSELSVGNKPEIISEEILDIVYDRYAVPVGTNITYGLGVNKKILPSGQEQLFHTGAVYGHNSALYRGRQSKTAVFVVVNEDSFGATIADALADYILLGLTGTLPEGSLEKYLDGITKTVFGLTAAGEEEGGEGEGAEDATGDQASASEAQSQDPAQGSPAAAGIVTPPENPRPVPDNIIIQGTYSAPGYPDITFRPLNLSDPVAVDETGISTQTLLEAGQLGITGDTLAYIGDSALSFISFALLTHFDGPAFNYTLFLTVPKIGELDTNGTVVANWAPSQGDNMSNKLYGFGPAVFGSGAEGQAGVGFFGSWYGAPGAVLTTPEYAEDDVESTAGAFYAKQ